MKKILVLLCSIMAVFLTGCNTHPTTNSMQSSTQVRESNQPFTDSSITAKVKAAFINEKVFGHRQVSAMSVHVETINSVVYLSGTANSQMQVRNAIRIAEAVKGVRRVESRIVVVVPTRD